MTAADLIRSVNAMPENIFVYADAAEDDPFQGGVVDKENLPPGLATGLRVCQREGLCPVHGFVERSQAEGEAGTHLFTTLGRPWDKLPRGTANAWGWSVNEPHVDDATANQWRVGSIRWNLLYGYVRPCPSDNASLTWHVWRSVVGAVAALGRVCEAIDWENRRYYPCRSTMMAPVGRVRYHAVWYPPGETPLRDPMTMSGADWGTPVCGQEIGPSSNWVNCHERGGGVADAGGELPPVSVEAEDDGRRQARHRRGADGRREGVVTIDELRPGQVAYVEETRAGKRSLFRAEVTTRFGDTAWVGPLAFSVSRGGEYLFNQTNGLRRRLLAPTPALDAEFEASGVDPGLNHVFRSSRKGRTQALRDLVATASDAANIFSAAAVGQKGQHGATLRAAADRLRRAVDVYRALE